APLGGAVAPFEEDADLEALMYNPLLELDKLDMQPRKLPLVLLPLQRTVSWQLVILAIGHRIHPEQRLHVWPLAKNCPKCVLLPAKNETDVPGISRDLQAVSPAPAATSR